MSYAAPRKAKTIKALTAKVIGSNDFVQFKAGTICRAQRNPSQPGLFVIWFSQNKIVQVPAKELPETIEFTDGKPEGWQG